MILDGHNSWSAGSSRIVPFVLVGVYESVQSALRSAHVVTPLPGGSPGSPVTSKLPLALLRYTPLVVGLLVVVAVSWVLVTRPTDEATWLQVEIPAQVASGERMPVTITLKAPVPAGFLSVDLHWMDESGKSHGYLSAAPARLIRSSELVYRFDLPVPVRPGLDAVFGVMVVSATGEWVDRTRVCTFEPVAVTSKVDPAKAGQLHGVIAHEQLLEPSPPRQDSSVMRWAGVLLWSLAGIVSWRMRLLARGAGPGLVFPLASRWAGLALACLLAAVWEASGVESSLGDLLRRIATDHGFYEGRRHWQEALTVIVVTVSVLVAVAALRRDHAQPVSVVFTGADAYWAISAISFISLHDADAWLATPVLRIPVVQVVKLAAALVAVSGAARAALDGR